MLKENEAEKIHLREAVNAVPTEETHSTAISSANPTRNSTAGSVVHSDSVSSEENENGLPNVGARNRVHKVIAPSWLTGINAFIDIIVVSLFGMIASTFTVFLCCVAITGGRVSEAVLIIDTTLWIALAAALIFFICSLCPIWLGLLALAAQITSGRFIGQVIIDNLCYTFAVDPQTLGPFFLFAASSVITILVTVLPIFALPLYRAIMESSPLRSTPGPLVTGSMVGDLRGNRLSFGKAFYRSLIDCWSPVLRAVAVVRGQGFKDNNQWFEETTKTIRLKRPIQQTLKVSHEREAVKVGYRIFQEVEYLFSRDDSAGPKIIQREDVPFTRALSFLQLLFYLTGACAIYAGLHCPFNIMNVSALNGTTPSNPAFVAMLMSAISASNIPLAIEYIFATLLAAVLMYVTFSLCRPTHIELRKEGLRFNSSRMPLFMQDNLVPWSEVERMYIEHHATNTSIADRWLVFGLLKGKHLRLRLGSISSVQGREEILKAVERWAPTLPRSVEVIASLQPPSDFSYTELWLEALSAPPKRDRLKPLIEGAVLKDRRYLVTRMLGSGGQGTAYLVEDVTAGQSVVLKEFVLPVYVDVGVRRQALEVFEREARLLKHICHPNVVKLVDYFIEDHRAYLVLEHIDGDSLRTIVEREGPMTEEKVRRLGVQMCDILEYLHGQSPPVVHRDFTPENLILRNDGTLKLIDFNVAQQSERTIVSSVVGKPAYLPPEQFRGTPTTQSDLYALGGCLHFLLTGEDPVPISRCDIQKTRADVSAELAHLLASTTEQELDNRIREASMIRDALEVDPR